MINYIFKIIIVSMYLNQLWTYYPNYTRFIILHIKVWTIGWLIVILLSNDTSVTKQYCIPS